MITILERPEGHVLDTTEKTATVSESYGAGDAQFVAPTVHDLADGDYIYSVSDIEDYAGFFYVDVITTGIFKLKTSEDGDYVQFIASGSITYNRSDLTHGWSAVHLPITYRISNDLYPVNSSDTSRDINSVTSVYGYSVIHISGSLGSAINSFDFIKLTVPNDTEISGVYQIIEFISPTVLIINLEYDGTVNWTGAQALKHYNNYNILVRVYAGLNSSHEWANVKPYELAATLELTPDENNECFFSINEILKSYITTRNNTGLATLPNNIDFMTMFYIATAESYDDSDGYAFGTTITPAGFTSDQDNFEGYAVNAKLEFKNLYSGYMSEYISQLNGGRFLTLFDRGTLFDGQYHDISFIYNNGGIQFRNTEFSANIDDWENFDGSDRGSEEPFSWTSVFGGSAVADGFNESHNKNNTKYFVQYKGGGWPVYTYTIEIQATNSSPSNDFTLRVFGMNDSSSQTEQTVTGTVTFPNGATTTRTISFTTSQVWNYLAFAFDNATNIIVSIQSIQIISPAGIVFKKEYYLAGDLQSTVETVLSDGTDLVTGVYRCEIEADCDYDRLDVSVTDSYGTIIAAHTLDINCECSNQEVNMGWLNNLGGFDYWTFKAQKDHIVEIREAIETKKNILPQWPKSYGSTADTIRKQTARVSNNSYTVRSQFLTEDQVNAISFIKSSVLVQIITSRHNKRTVIVDTDSFVKFKDGDKTFEIAFNISFTDDIPVQTV